MKKKKAFHFLNSFLSLVISYLSCPLQFDYTQHIDLRLSGLCKAVALM